MRFLIIEARYYENIADMLLEGATKELEKLGVDYEVITVPGAFEIPSALSMAISMFAEPIYDAYITLGCIIRGKTAHFDIIANECASGINRLAIENQEAVGFGVLTTENMEQAIERASVNGQNKGASAAKAAYQMFALKKYFEDSNSETILENMSNEDFLD